MLLDGLDEVEESRAERLLRSLNSSFLHRYADLTTVVSSRTLEYEILTREREKILRLNGAVTLQPLDREQINAYLEAAHAKPLADALAGDPELYELAETPLTLSMMTLASADVAPASAPPSLNLTERRRHLFDTYVERMVQRAARRKAGKPFDLNPEEDVPAGYTLEQVNRFLGWLAVRLSERAQTRFASDDLMSLLAREAAPTSRAQGFWTERRTAPFVLMFLLSAAVSGLFFARSSAGSPWFLFLIGPAAFLWSSGFRWWTSVGRKGASKSRVPLLAVTLTLLAPILIYILLAFYFVVTLLVERLSGASWVTVFMLVLAAVGFMGSWGEASYEERRGMGRTRAHKFPKRPLRPIRRSSGIESLTALSRKAYREFVKQATIAVLLALTAG